MTARAAQRLWGGLLAAATFALGVTRISDPDAWTHLALGRAMARLRGFPPHEPLTFAGASLPYYNTEWLYDWVLYLTYLAAGLAGPILLTAAVAALAMWVMWKDATLSGAGRSALRAGIAAVVLGAAALLIRHRIVERPDVCLMVFVAFSIYALRAYLVAGRRLLFALPLVQILWVNVHPSAVVAAGPFAAVLAGGLLQRGIGRWRGAEPPETPSAAQLRTVGIIFALVLVASPANPYGSDPLTLPLRLTESRWFSSEVWELQPTRFSDYPGLWSLLGLLALTFVALARRLPVIDILTVLPFAWLGLSAQRFVFLAAIVAAPVLARNLGDLAVALNPGWSLRAAVGVVAAAGAAVAAATGLALANAPPLRDPWRAPGIGVNAAYVPEGALAYLNRSGVEGRVFNTFHWGGYIAWRDLPRLTPMVDGRAWLPSGLVEEIHFARFYARHLERLQAEYGFDVAVVDYPVGVAEGVEGLPPGVDLALTAPGWALVYWDDVALVYLKRGLRWQPVIERDQYRQVKPANGPLFLAAALADKRAIPAVESELRRDIAQTGSSRAWMLLGLVLYEAGDDERAIDAFGHVRGGPALADALQGLGRAWWRKGDTGRAVETYRRLARLEPSASALELLGRVQLEAGLTRAAMASLEEARGKDPGLLAVYPALAEAYRREGKTGALAALTEAFREQTAAARAAERGRRGLDLFRAGKSEAAVAELKAAQDMDSGRPKAWTDLGYVYLDLGRPDDAAAQFERALALDARFAPAHYGLGVVAERRGDAAAARRHFEAYVRLDPRSYLSWRVRERLRRQSP